MFKSFAYRALENDRIKKAILDRCEKARQAPFVPSAEMLNTGLMIAYMPTEEMLEYARSVSNLMPDACEKAMGLPAFNPLIRSLDLNLQKVQLLSIGKLVSLFVIGMKMGAEEDFPIPPPPLADIARLFRVLNDGGISFEMLAAIDDHTFEPIVLGATALITLESEGVPLTNLLSLNFFQISALVAPSDFEDEMIASYREEAMDLLKANPQPAP